MASNPKADKIIAGLDPNQKVAAQAIQGPVAIVAGAGTGKTRTITHRIAYACALGEWKPEEVMAVTFTAKAAREMKERLEGLGVFGVSVNTFHAQALAQLRDFWPRVVGTKPPKLETNKLLHIMDAAQANDIELTKSEAYAIGDEIGWCKVSLVAPSDYEETVVLNERETGLSVNPRVFARLYDEYDNIKSERGLVDFEDMLLLMIHLIKSQKKIADEVHEKYKHLIVDEYQDVSPLQQMMLDSWLGKSREICVVGDPSQTIYSFTGATPTYLLDFHERFAPKNSSQTSPRRCELINDYRSSSQIVKLANNVLKLRGRAGFEPLKLVSKAPKTDQEVLWHVYPDNSTEAKQVAQMIKQKLSGGKLKPTDVAILTRTNAQLDDFAYALRAIGVPAFIKLDKKVPEDDEDEGLNRPDGVTLASLHSSKGLEWECVFLAGLSDGQVPFARSKSEYAIEEERRLLYVGITRAKEELHMSYARSKQQGGKPTRNRSRFLDGIWPAST
jgi:DNA helicase-2/ATP-dependent DNA helicase PcrA